MRRRKKQPPTPTPLKIYLGCGTVILDGWQNLDNRTHLDSRIVRWEAPERLPYGDSTAEAVITAHMLNHLEESWYLPLFQDVYRVLKPGCVFRLQEDLTENPTHNWPRQPGQRGRGQTGMIRSLPTKRKMLLALRRAGFKVRRARPGHTISQHKDVCSSDGRNYLWRSNRKIYLEGIKPAGV